MSVDEAVEVILEEARRGRMYAVVDEGGTFEVRNELATKTGAATAKYRRVCVVHDAGAPPGCVDRFLSAACTVATSSVTVPN